MTPYRRFAVVPFALIAFACSSSSSPGSPPASAGASADASTEDAAPPRDASPVARDASGDAVASGGFDAGTAYIRLVNASPDGPALDFCYALEDNTDFRGPILATPGGVAYGQATTYLAVPADSYSVRLVTAGSKDCSTSVGAFATTVDTLDDGQRASLVASGDLNVAGSDASFGLRAYLDDGSSSVQGDVALRFIDSSSNAAPVDFGEGALASASFTPLFTSTADNSAGSQVATDAGVDTNLYVELPPISGATISAHAHAASSDLVAATETAPAGDAVTVFLIGGKSGDASHPPRFLSCDDNAAPKGQLGACDLLAM